MRNSPIQNQELINTQNPQTDDYRYNNTNLWASELIQGPTGVEATMGWVNESPSGVWPASPPHYTNIHRYLNNDGQTMIRRPPDLTIINNTLKNNHPIRAVNVNDGTYVSRRASEPPQYLDNRAIEPKYFDNRVNGSNYLDNQVNDPKYLDNRVNEPKYLDNRANESQYLDSRVGEPPPYLDSYNVEKLPSLYEGLPGGALPIEHENRFVFHTFILPILYDNTLTVYVSYIQ